LLSQFPSDVKAGTGKSFLLRTIVEHLRTVHGHGSNALGITASTGIASVNIGGCTVHSWSGIGIGQEDADKIAKKLTYQQMCAAAKDRWLGVRALIIDESGWNMIDRGAEANDCTRVQSQ
jgi:ATP-dependent DNA helicase PIF1